MPSSAALPNLPQISVELSAKVFRHKSLTMGKTVPQGIEPVSLELFDLHGFASGEPNSQQIDNERLALYGNSLLNSCVTGSLMNKFPLEKVGYLSAMRSRLVAKENVAQWSRAYALQDRLEHAPALNIKNVPSALIDVFYAYLAAIATDHGTSALEEWVSRLLAALPASFWARERKDETEEITYERVDYVDPVGSIPASIPGYSPAFIPSSSQASTSSPPNVQRKEITIAPAPASSPIPTPTPTKSYVSQFMEIATARHEREYKFTFVAGGSDHMRLWQAKLHLNGELIGSGEAVTKASAKNLAALEGLRSKGWPITD